jgi:hypothetical protein
MIGWHIFVHSVGMVFRNLNEAVKIGLVPVIILALVVAGLVSFSGLTLDLLSDEEALGRAIGTGQVGLAFVLILLAWVIVTLWIFVSWHRFILLEEYPQSWIPPFRFDRILAYLWRGIVLGLIAAALMLPTVGIAAVVGSVVPGLAVILTFVAILALVVVVYRLVAILPAAAIGQPLTIGQAWEATRGATGAIFGLLLVSFLAQVLLQLVSGAILAVIPVLGVLFQFLVTLIMSLVNVSVLTTFYGHYIEGRPID